MIQKNITFSINTDIKTLQALAAKNKVKGTVDTWSYARIKLEENQLTFKGIHVNNGVAALPSTDYFSGAISELTPQTLQIEGVYSEKAGDILWWLLTIIVLGLPLILGLEGYLICVPAATVFGVIAYFLRRLAKKSVAMSNTIFPFRLQSFIDRSQS
jgi:hypothetical protein